MKKNTLLKMRLMKREKVKAKEKESEEYLLQHYFKDYGEVPPINQVLPDARYWLDKLL